VFLSIWLYIVCVIDSTCEWNLYAFRAGVGGKMLISGTKVRTTTCACHSVRVSSDGLGADIKVDRQLGVDIEIVQSTASLPVGCWCHFIHHGIPSVNNQADIVWYLHHTNSHIGYGCITVLHATVFTRKQLLLSACLSHCNSVSVCLSVRLSHRWISQKRCKLGSPNFHCWLPGRL